SGVFDGDGRPIGYVGAYRDVTERKLIEAASSAVASDLDPMSALTRFADVLREVTPFTQLSLSVIEGDHYRRVVSVGSDTKTFFAEELVPLEGNSIKQAVDTHAPVIVDDTTQGRWPYDRRLARLGVGSYVVLPLIQEGRAFATFNIGFDQPHAPNDKVVDMMRAVASGVVQGVKNLLLYEQQRESVEQLRAVDEMKNSFLQAVSHELRTPLTAVLGLSLTLEQRADEFPPEQRSEILRMIVGNARKLERLLADLLDLDRLTRGALKPHLRETDVALLARNIAAEVDLEGRPLKIHCDPVHGLVDGPKVERIVENLLVNVARHTPPDTRVWLHVDDTPEGILIVAEDDGPGVADAAKEAIFELFSQGTDAQATGTGVGLTLVTRFAALHGGRAWVEDRAGGGASFRVLLPYEPALA
ncbi:MAG: ATP-binding protein, partial [Actinomycetota bacterium]